MKKFLILLLIFPILLSSCGEHDGSEYIPEYAETAPLSNIIYIFGVHPLHNPKRLFEVYQPMIDYINARLNGAELRLEASRNYPAYDKKLFGGYFHFSLPNPYQTVTATQSGYKIFGKMSDDNNFRGIILVRKDSDIQNVSDLKGKNVSYPAPTALAATMMPQWYLYQHGININKDITNLYVGSQESSIMNVYLKKSAAASTWPPPWRAFIKQRPEVAAAVMIKWETPPLPNNGLVVRNDVPQSVVRQVRDIILSLHTHAEGKTILEAMELSRYEAADDSTYEPVKEFLKKFEKEVRPIRLAP
ncbi:MAG: phosphate/phosphite/phosphonate ABC transporter substrate-binding protein [gamma proteobacterium symbiont of Taylorina sp.]|nr:phosphate/phosphite/phosphonate ABC transporter substrate-binding protein [gamma proteobacterium symbiont of Taylorina sp.]